MSSSFKYALIHKLGCGDVAFYGTHIPVVGERSDPSGYCWPDGSSIVSGEQVRCGSCGEILTSGDLDLDNNFWVEINR